jgi:transposase
MKASGDSLLRLLRRTCAVKASSPRVIGVDDWAYRRGRRYGTLLCDLETHRPIDLLPDRSADSFHAWLVQHPDIRVVARDRGEYYARGATSGAPHAVQVADRWHLLRNLSDALKRMTDRRPRQIAEAWQAVNQSPSSSPPATVVASPPTPEGPIHYYRDARRRAHYDQAHQLHKQGHAQRSIARQLGINRETVQRYLRANSFPERAIPGRRTPLCRYRAELWRQWSAGRRNAAELYRELAGAGFQGSYHMMTRCIRQWRQQFPEPNPAQPPLRRPSARRVAWLLTRSAADLSADETALISQLKTTCPEIFVARNLALRFVAMVRDRKGNELDAWIAAATAADSPRDLQGLACGFQADLAAVRAALELPWSNGQTEGHVHRLKALKRQMYGRANFDLLRIRVLNAA